MGCDKQGLNSSSVALSLLTYHCYVLYLLQPQLSKAHKHMPEVKSRFKSHQSGAWLDVEVLTGV